MNHRRALDGAMQLDESVLCRAARSLTALGIATILLGFVGLVAWAAVAPLPGAIIAGGLLKVDTYRKTVQHRDGGIVREILVRDGDEVKKDQPLIVLEDARIDSSFAILRAQLGAEMIKRVRLAAERDLVSSWTVPAQLKESALAHVPEIVAREQALFAARRKALHSQITIIQQEMTEAQEEIGAREALDASARNAAKLMEDEVTAHEALFERGMASKAQIRGLQRQAAEHHTRTHENMAKRAEARQRKSSLEVRIAALRGRYVEEATADLRDTTNRIVDLEERLHAARDAFERKVIVAPVAGRVVDLKVTTPGATLGPRDPILDIVPMDNPLVVEARVSVDAISDLRPGLQADLRLTAYKSRTTPLILGKVTYVSADALTDRPTGAPYYVIHLQLDPESLRQAEPIKVYPGMAVEVFIRTRARTALDYLLEPLSNSMRRAFREH